MHDKPVRRKDLVCKQLESNWMRERRENKRLAKRNR